MIHLKVTRPGRAYAGWNLLALGDTMSDHADDAQEAAKRGDVCIACSRRLCQFLPDGQHPRRRKDLDLKRGDKLEAPDGACLRFWTIVTGTAAICTSFEDGRRQILGLETKGGTVCGPMSAAENGTWLEALDDCHICELDFSDSASQLQDNAAFLFAVFNATHRRLEDASRHVATLGRLDSTERVILFLADMARRSAPRKNGTGLVSLPMSREDIADYLGLNAETVSRIMSRIKKSGLIRFLSATEYDVPDFAAIERRLPVPIPDRRTGPFLELTASETMIREVSG